MTVDAREIDLFEQLAEDWWDPKGPMAPLHHMNPLRLQFIKKHICGTLDLDYQDPRALSGLKILDVGCGCGLLSEPLCRMGADVTAIDPAKRNIEVARLHAQASDLDIHYRSISTAGLIEEDQDQRFDIITCLEVIEHVEDPGLLVGDLAYLGKPSSLVFLSTLTRSFASYAKAIIGAEYVMGILPRGTHDWKRFIKPSELAALLRQAGISVLDIQGVDYDPVRKLASFTRKPDCNYLMAGTLPSN